MTFSNVLICTIFLEKLQIITFEKLKPAKLKNLKITENHYLIIKIVIRNSIVLVMKNKTQTCLFEHCAAMVEHECS